ncbi:hypothetical protein DFQ26_008240 [Actinomortierella ambigua]|nr:hypothetical protein DFQ26_008240 [Actinomortierella ambigua]
MLQRFLGRSAKAITADSKTQLFKSSRKGQHRALAIDIILCEILSYLSLQERRRVKLVCKRWNQFCDQFWRSSKKWTSSKGYSPECAKELANVYSVQCEFSKYVRATVDPAAWLLFWQTVSQARKRNQVKQLEFCEEVDVDLHVIPILHEIPWVTSLRIDANVARKVDIQIILESLPQLRQLDVSGAVLENKGNNTVLPLSRLTHLGLDNCHVTQGFMDELLDCFPRLGSLQLTSIYMVSTSGRGRNPPMDILPMIKRCCPTANPMLDEIFLEASYCYDILRALLEMPQYLQRTTKFRYRIHAQSYWKTFTTVSLEYMTRLEIRGKYWLHDFPVEALHTYLCHDDARHLRELVAPDIFYPDEYLDPNLIQKKQYGTWSSRDLVVLQMGFGPEEADSGDDTKHRQLLTRHIFGFIVSMCPRLTDLWVRCKAVDFSLEGGMCYLTRLERLQTLKIQTVDMPVVTEHDLVWLFHRRAQFSSSSSFLSSPLAGPWRSVGTRKSIGGEITGNSVRTMEKVCRAIEGDFAALRATRPETKPDGISVTIKDNHAYSPDAERGEQQEEDWEGRQGSTSPSSSSWNSRQGGGGGNEGNHLALLQSLTVEYSSERYLGRRKEEEKESIGPVLKRIRPRLETQVYFCTWIERQYNHP